VTSKALLEDTPGRRLGRRLPAVLIACFAASFLLIPTGANASAARPLSVSLTFDDGIAEHKIAQQLLKKYGMGGTFYINSGLIGLPGYLTQTELNALWADGNEIGGHTVSHQSLPSLPLAEANRQICQDRNTLLSWGYPVTSFAYPFVEFNADIKTIAKNCGYNTARSVGDLWSPRDCTDCPNTETIPPADLYETKTPGDIDTTWTLNDMKNAVTRAEATGGWLAFNFHHICEACVLQSIRPAVLDQFLAWLKPRSAATIRTTVKTVQQVVTGAVKPAVAPIAPPPPGGPGVNTVRNASLETPSTVNPNLADCWNSAGYGTNTVTYARVTDAHSGTAASRITVTSRTDGDAKLTPTFDLGHCSNQVAANRTYEVSTWYKSTAQVFFTLYKRDAVGAWAYWTQSPRLTAASAWTRASWLTPVPPTGTTAVSFGLTIDSVGTLTTDDYGFADTQAVVAPPGTNALKNPSLEAVGADGFPQCWIGAGYGTNTTRWTRVTDAANGSFAQQLEVLTRTDGDAKLISSWDSANCAPKVTVGSAYTLGVSYKSTKPVFFTVYRQDANGVWSYWTQSPDFPTSTAYQAVTWKSPAVPAGTTAVTFGLTLDEVGSVTTDNYSFVAS
jgi:peptidoglycan/xylan/chitin deacetylase (PgdA/CDA1 family)